MGEPSPIPLTDIWVISLIGGLGLFNFPFLDIFNSLRLFLGLPLLVVYLMGCWITAIAALFFFSRRFSRSDADERPPEQ